MATGIKPFTRSQAKSNNFDSSKFCELSASTAHSKKKTRKQSDMSNTEETSAATTHDQVKLVKVNPKDEALPADESGSSHSHSHQRDTNCDQCRQHRLYNATRKVFRDFDKSMPTIWFSLFELKLQQCGPLADEQRKNALTSCLPNDILLTIHDLLINQASYQCIKQRLLQWFEPNLSSRVTELLNYSSVTAEKPSQFLLMLRTKLAKSDMSQEMIRELFIAKMPENIRNCLKAVKNLSLDELAITADQMISIGKESAVKNTLFAIDHKKSEQSAASNNSDILTRMDSLEKKLNDVLNFTKSGKSNKFNKQQLFNQFNKGNKWKTREQPDVCWFHKTFGSRAKKCTKPCNFIAGNE